MQLRTNRRLKRTKLSARVVLLFTSRTYLPVSRECKYFNHNYFLFATERRPPPKFKSRAAFMLRARNPRQKRADLAKNGAPLDDRLSCPLNVPPRRKRRHIIERAMISAALADGSGPPCSGASPNYTGSVGLIRQFGFCSFCRLTRRVDAAAPLKGGCLRRKNKKKNK